MNTDIFCPIHQTTCPVCEIEQLERELRQIRRAALNNLTSWTQFVVDFCNRHGASYTRVIGNEMIVECLNLRWLRTGKRFWPMI